jgi:hypothetical protein
MDARAGAALRRPRRPGERVRCPDPRTLRGRSRTPLPDVCAGTPRASGKFAPIHSMVPGAAVVGRGRRLSADALAEELDRTTARRARPKQQAWEGTANKLRRNLGLPPKDIIGELDQGTVAGAGDAETQPQSAQAGPIGAVTSGRKARQFSGSTSPHMPGERS